MRAAAFSSIGLLVLEFAAVGCGGRAATEQATPTAPSRTPEEVLVGHWAGEVEIDEDVVSEKLAAVQDADEPTRNRVYWSIETPASLKSKLTLDPGGQMTMIATVSTADGEKTIDGSGTWEVISAEGDQAKVRLNYDGQVEEKVFVFDDADAFATDPPGIDKTIGTLKFRRLR